MSFCDGSDKVKASNFVQILEKVQQRPWPLDVCSGKNAWAVEGKCKLTETVKGEPGEEQSQEHAHHLFLAKNLYCRPNSQCRTLLWWFTVTAWKCAKTSPWTLATKELAVASRQRTISHVLFHRVIFYQKQQDCHPPPPIHPTFLFHRLKTKLKGRHFDTIGRIAGGAEQPHRTRLPGCI
jgi:hypothetical protein